MPVPPHRGPYGKRLSRAANGPGPGDPGGPRLGRVGLGDEQAHHLLGGGAGGLADEGAGGVVAQLVGDRGAAERLVHPTLRRLPLGAVRADPVHAVVGQPGLEGAEPFWGEALGERVGVVGLRVEDVAMRGMEVEEQGETGPAVRPVLGECVAQGARLRLREPAPIAVQVDAVHVVAPMARVDAVRVDQRHDHEVESGAEPRGRLRLGDERLDERHQGERAGHLGRVLAPDEEHASRRLRPGGLQLVDRAAEHGTTDHAFAQERATGDPVGPGAQLLAGHQLLRADPKGLGAHVEPQRGLPLGLVAGVRLGRERGPGDAVAADLGMVAMRAPFVRQADRDRARHRRRDPKGVPGAVVDRPVLGQDAGFVLRLAAANAVAEARAGEIGVERDGGRLELERPLRLDGHFPGPRDPRDREDEARGEEQRRQAPGRGGTDIPHCQAPVRERPEAQVRRAGSRAGAWERGEADRQLRDLRSRHAPCGQPRPAGIDGALGVRVVFHPVRRKRSPT